MNSDCPGTSVLRLGANAVEHLLIQAGGTVRVGLEKIEKTAMSSTENEWLAEGIRMDSRAKRMLEVSMKNLRTGRNRLFHPRGDSMLPVDAIADLLDGGTLTLPGVDDVQPPTAEESAKLVGEALTAIAQTLHGLYVEFIVIPVSSKDDRIKSCWKMLLDLPRPPVCWVGKELCQDPQS
jgi:hypothetical protein